MHQPTDTHHTAKDLSTEELKEYRKRLDQHFQNRKVDKALLQRAWQTAHKIAAMLYDDFGATKVAVFGSLVEKDSFSKWSDLDIAVWGIRNDEYFRAIWQAEGISGLFKIDLIDFESFDASYQERIKTQAVEIEKGKRYNLDKSRLVKDILDERLKIEKSIQGIKEALEIIETDPELYRREIEITISKYLSDVYMGIEYIMTQIALDVDLHLPDQLDIDRCNKDLLEQMTQSQAERPPVISKKSFEVLQEYLVYRNLFINTPIDELDYENTERKAKQIDDVYTYFSKELDDFIDYLKNEND